MFHVPDIIVNGFIQLVQLVLEASSECLFQFIKILEVDSKLDLSEDALKSKYFYWDCMYWMFNSTSLKQSSLADGSEDINYDEFYKYFIYFIQNVREVKIKKDFPENLRKLIELLQIVYFTSGEDSNFSNDEYAIERFRYIESFVDENGEKHFIDVKTQTKRFWITWIVGKDLNDISKDVIESGKMKKEELFFWLIFAAIYNFSTYYGDSELTGFFPITFYWPCCIN